MKFGKKIIDRLRLFRNIVRSEQKCIDSIRNSNSFYASELIRYTHSMEKGLSIENPKLGFGHKKQESMLYLLDKLKDCNDKLCIEARQMAIDSLNRYLEYHKVRGFSDEMIRRIESAMTKEKHTLEVSYGGTVEINKEDLKADIPEIEKFFNTRHSIRDFAEDDVVDEELMRALTLAQRAPSACNRQGYRVHILGKEKSKKYAKSLSGIGGFAENVNRFVMITGKLSAYRVDEINQYIVSASMYASYLTLTLHLYGMGSCLVQRPLIWDKNWDELRISLGIPEDEQLICLLSVGKLKDKMQVPESHRLNPQIMFDFKE